MTARILGELETGRNLGSKSSYHLANPTHDVHFNANIFYANGAKLWWGDLDLTLDAPMLQETANRSGETLFILRERDGRFDNEKNPPLDRAVRKFEPQR